MCLEDVRISQRAEPHRRTYQSDGAGSIYIPANLRRIALYIPVAGASRAVYAGASPTAPPVAVRTDPLDEGQVLALTYQSYPGILGGELRVSGVGANQPITVLEVYLSPEFDRKL